MNESVFPFLWCEVSPFDTLPWNVSDKGTPKITGCVVLWNIEYK